jgi:class 3 adenylate cyclase
MEGAVSAVSSLGRSKSEPEAVAPARSGTHWVAVMFTDLSDSTGLAESMGDEEWSQVLANHRSIVRDCLRKHGGEEIGTQGDGFLVRYESPADAVAGAVAIQRAHDKRRQGRQYVPDVRVGIHAGDTVHDDGDLIGQVVNIAARVTSVATPGQILVTEQVADRLDPGVDLEDCGLHELRGVSRPRHLLAVEY